ncbi:hypothetical protein C8F04DRAFT_1182581 [Mycena alexandri]|uniref:SnoaL-like domain-containing protein n=1 Tax=Mycena alexandri TaxID=1745969 RepID=A0AAD6SY28_9AGAR|nr:hypothetical protein C8F04DRAFT_1182581 [Mycena alexandri]
MSDLNAKQLENAHAFLKHLNALEWGPLGNLLAPDFKHQYFPATIVPPGGKDTRGKAEFMHLFQHSWIHVFEKITVGAHLILLNSTVIDNAAVWGTIGCDTRREQSRIPHGMSKSGKKYNNEYMLTFHFEGEKITKMNEFVDSAYSAAFFTAE